MAEARPKVLIAGGGIGGLATALALRRHGVAFALFEQAAALREVGAGIQLNANAVKVRRALGVGEALERISVRPAGLDVRSWQTGERAEANFGAPYYHAHRAELLDLLLAALGGDGVHLHSRVTGFRQDGGGVTLTLADGAVRRITKAHRIVAGD